MKNYQEWYQNISSRLTSHPTLLFLLRSFNRLMTVAMPLVYLTLLVTTYLQLGLGQQVGVYLLIPASGFVILSLFRKKINHPRPYETWGISPLLEKDSSGQSMPSRHASGLPGLASHHLPATRTWSASWGLFACPCLRFCDFVSFS